MATSAYDRAAAGTSSGVLQPLGPFHRSWACSLAHSLHGHLQEIMAGTLRTLAQTARQAIRSSAPSSLQQQRHAGNLPVKPNKYIEDWHTAREHIELTYKWDGETLRKVFVWVGLVPFVVYKISTFEFKKNDRKYGRKEREFM